MEKRENRTSHSKTASWAIDARVKPLAAFNFWNLLQIPILLSELGPTGLIQCKWKEQSSHLAPKDRPLPRRPVKGGWNEETRLSSYRKEVFFSFCLGKIICGVVCPVAKAKVVKMDWGYRNFISCFLKISTTSGLTSSSNATLINWRQKRLNVLEALRISR